MSENRHLPEDYRAAKEGAVFRPLPAAGYLRLSGGDRMDFLQRQTTNDVSALRGGRALMDVLTSPTARILDVFELILEDEHIGVLTQPGRGEGLASYLRGKVFFMDDVAIEDASEEIVQVELDGPHAADVLTRLGAEQVPEQGELVEERINDAAVRIIGQAGLAGTGYRLLIPAAQADEVEAALRGVGAVRLSDAVYEVLRVEAGLPAVGAELSEDYTPLEVGLSDAVSLSKGCYTGQEVLARQVNYDKVTRQMAGLALEQPVPPGSALRAEGRPAGAVTSVAESPVHGWIALAVVKRPHDEPGSELTVRTDDQEIRATVRTLPSRASEGM